MIRIKIRFLTISISILILSSCSANEISPKPATPSSKVHPYWLKTYESISGGNSFDSAKKTKDGGYIVAGKVNYQLDDLDNFNVEAGIIKLDAGGNIQWQYGFGKKQDYNGFLFVQQTSDGGYLALGKSSSQSVLVKLGTNGVLKWQKAFPGHCFQYSTETGDGDFILTGYSNAFGPDISIVIARIGADGLCRWQRVYGEGCGRVIRQLADGGFIVLATDIRLNRSVSLILKLDSNGALQWEKQYRGSLVALELAADGGFMLAGTVSVSPKRVFGAPAYIGTRVVPIGPQAVNVQGWLLKLDRYGNEQWQKLYGGVFEDEFTSLEKTSDGNFVVLGSTDNYGSGNGDLWLLKISDNGSINWQETIGGEQHDDAKDLELLDDGGFLIAATSGSFGRGSGIPMLIKVDAKGVIPESALELFHPSNSTAEDDEDRKIEIIKRGFTTPGQDVAVSPINTDLVPDALSLVAASLQPPEPKLLVSQREITMTTFAHNRRGIKYSYGLSLRNIGAKELTIDKIEISEVAPSRNALMTLIYTIRNFIFRNETTYESELTGRRLKPDGSCRYRFTITVNKSMNRKAKITINSNDPDTPVITIPVNIISR